ncbi:MAG: translation initiation factor IF-3 [Verrucomicrobiales bacterium]
MSARPVGGSPPLSAPPPKPKPTTNIAKPKRKRRFQPRDRTRVNERIRAPKVRVIEAATNSQLGVMSSRDALALAKQKGLDLVEIAANADPPVCKIVDYGKYKYDLSKKQKEHPKSKAGKVKEIKFRVGIDPHDYGIKMGRAEGFLDHGDKVRFVLMFRGRENAHPELGFQLMEKVVDDLKTMGHVDYPPKKVGRSIGMMLSPLPKDRRKRKFKPVEHDFEDEEDEDDDDEHGEDAHDESHDGSEEE